MKKNVSRHEGYERVDGQAAKMPAHPSLCHKDKSFTKICQGHNSICIQH